MTKQEKLNKLIVQDYEYCSTKCGGELEVWEHKTNGNIILVPVEIIRDFENALDEDYKPINK
jgi:hypothetical protein